jgi:hypothetical protein
MANKPNSPFYWENFKENYLDGSAPSIVRILDEPRIEIITQPDRTRVSLRILTNEVPVVVPVPRAIEAQYLSTEGKKFFEVSTSVRQLHRPFFFLMLAIREQLSSSRTTAAGALAYALGEYRQLLAMDDTLSAERLLGLFGELWTLKQLIAHNGAVFVRSWLGPVPLIHDFRFGSIELEVKTTKANIRSHRINGAAQLMPSPGCDLYMISIQAQETGPGGGASVPELVQEIAMGLATYPPYGTDFESRLRSVGYVQEHEMHYDARFILRTPPVAILIDSSFPRITIDQVNSINPEVASRISGLEYTLDVSGLGIECGTSISQKLVQL